MSTEGVRSGRGLAVLALVVSIIALGMLLLAYQEVGSTRALLRQVERLQDVVEASQRGGFGLVVGVDRYGEPERLAVAGADLVVADLAELSAETGPQRKASIHQFTLNLERGQPVRLEKTLVQFTSRDRAISECGLAARSAVAQAGRFAERLEQHSRARELLWRRLDIEVESAHQEGGRADGAHPAPPRVPPPADGVHAHHGSGRRRPGARAARRGVPRPRLLG